MLKKALLTLLLGASLSSADVFVRVAPPRPLVESRGPMPGRGYVWIPGYHRWEGRAYVWVPGRWELAPHRRAHWVAHHWVHRRGGWVLIEGHWR